MPRIFTADKATGTFIDEFDTMREAEEAIALYELDDEMNHKFTPDFYDIVDEEHNSIMHPNGRQFYAVQLGSDDWDCGGGSFIYNDAYIMAEDAHERHPNEEVRIVYCREHSDFAEDVEVVFKGGDPDFWLNTTITYGGKTLWPIQ